jgi:hypothetical protein
VRFSFNHVKRKRCMMVAYRAIVAVVVLIKKR